jgi:hypothetical protein
MTMKSKLLAIAKVSLLSLMAVGAAACYEAGPAYPVYGGGYPAYGYRAPAPVVVGDYDEHHAWHDRNWWVANNRGWVQEHHSDWLNHHDEHGRG